MKVYNYSEKSNYRGKFIWVLFLLSMVCFVVVVFHNDYSKCVLLPLAPFMFSIVAGYFANKARNLSKSVVFIIVFAGFFVRTCLCSLLMVISDYNLGIPTSEWEDYLDWAVLLLLFEFITTIVYFISNRKVIDIVSCEENSSIEAYRLSLFTKAIVLFAGLFTVYCIVTNPSYLLYIKNTLEFISYTEQENALRNKLYFQMLENRSSLYTLYSTMLVFLQVLLPSVLLNAIYRNRLTLGNSKKRILSVSLSLLVLMISMLFLTEDNSRTIIVAASIFVTLIHIYPEYLRKWVPLVVSAGIILAFLLLMLKAGMFMGLYNGVSSLAKIINTYFAGIPNIAVGIKTNYPDKLENLIGDLGRSIPIFSHFFVNFTNSRELFNIAYHGVSGHLNEIMPTICYGYKYLGPLAPVVTIFTCNCAVRYEYDFLHSDNVFSKTIYAYLAIYLAICPTMYMFTSALNMIWYGLIFRFIAKTNSRK